MLNLPALAGWSCALLLALSQPAPALGALPAQQPPAPDEDLWREIVQVQTPASRPTTQDAAALARQRQSLLARAQTYLAAYPGGAHRDEAIRLELRTLFELGTLGGGDLAPLAARVAAYLNNPPSPAATCEAAYWKIICARAGRASATTQPSSGPFQPVDAPLLAAYRAYVEQYPASPHTPRLSEQLFDVALTRSDRPAMQHLAALLAREFPQDAITARVRAQLDREEAVGKPFWLTFPTGDTLVDTREWTGHPVIIMVWAGFDEPSCQRAGAVETLRQARPELRVVGVNLDSDEAAMRLASQRLGLPWPQFNDGLGWANDFARKWGVRQIPRVFVIDKAGRLAGSTTGDDWRKLLE
jgi:hypothetical protein